MRVGLDIGSTTIKCVVLNDAGQIVYSTYERHFSHILEKGRALLEKVAAEYLPDGRAYLAISGSAGMGLADSCRVPFVQEVFATRVAANRLTPGTDCIIAVSYTHLDVYKRQLPACPAAPTLQPPRSWACTPSMHWPCRGAAPRRPRER